MTLSYVLYVLLLLGVFYILLKYKNFIVQNFIKLRLPKILLALLCATPLIILEEHINCGAYGCTNVVLPPTLWMILTEQFLFFLILKAFRTTKILLPTILYCLFGVVFEFFIGAAKIELQQLFIESPLRFAILVLWVFFSYVFIIVLPLMVFSEASKIDYIKSK